MQRSKVDFWVGLFVMLGAAALIFLALQAANLLQINWNTNTYQVKAYFDNVGGLKPQAAVRSSGVVVGRVSSISFDDKVYRALVTLDMDNRYHFSTDSSLKILTSGLLGDQYIGIEAGYEEKNLQAGDTVNATQSAMVLENLISGLMFSRGSPESGAGNAASPSPSPSPESGSGSN